MNKTLPPAQMHVLNSISLHVYYINERIMTGDYYSAGQALPIAQKSLPAFVKELKQAGALDVWLNAFVAGGGFLGVSYQFQFAGEEFRGSMIPRRRP